MSGRPRLIGYWVPRALAFEHRIAAGVADPGVVDVSTTVLGHLPHMMIKLLEAGEREKFNRDMEWTLKISPSTRPMLALRMRPYGVTTPYEFFSASRDYALTDELIAQITTPVLVTSPDNEQFWPGQSEELFGKLTGRKQSSRSPRPREPAHTASPPPPASSTGSTTRSRPDRKGLTITSVSSSSGDVWGLG
jgi:hypothetical protein